ncbi:MAG: class I SAM-dependent methyltransferase [Planctomycetaceae bacterium]|nr:class I SAM-dependent methyltransferase [Planctomycetaceae bacterium]
MGLFSDLKVLYHMAVRPVRGKDHATRMENFYGGQAADYDDFRKRLLRGREELWSRLGVNDGGINDGEVWLDMGGGTGSNLEYFGENIKRLKKVYVVDLAGSLLKMAEKRARDRGWNNVAVAEADATKFVPEERQVDVITFSYSLTMIPDWFAAIQHAETLLRPGGRIGVVDFYVSRKHPEEGFQKHGWPTRAFWPNWFAADNVFPSPDHVPFLHRMFEPVVFEEYKTRIPWFPVPFFKMPYYVFVGKKT